MKAVIALSGLAGLLIFGPPFVKARTHRHEVSVIVHEATLAHKETQAHIEAAAHASWDGQDNCKFEAERTGSVPAGSVRELLLTAGAGSLEVVGVEGLDRVQMVGRACASHEEFLEDIQVTAKVEGSSLVMETQHPDLSGWRGGNRYARLDLRVEVPMGLAAEIRDGSGEITASGLGSLRIQDGSGEVTVTGITGDLAIQDGSGELDLRNISGSVEIQDGSGEIYLEGVGSDVVIHDSSGGLEILGIEGSVTLADSSGEIAVEDVSGSVTVLGDSSGDIRVDGVGGDFIVKGDGSGEIHFENVTGAVDVPIKKRGR